MNGKPGRGEGAAAGKPGDHNPVLPSTGGFSPQQHRLALLQRRIDLAQIIRICGGNLVVAGPVYTASGSIRQLFCHVGGIDGGACPIGFHHGNAGGCAADGTDGAAFGADGVACPTGICLFIAGYLHRNSGIACGIAAGVSTAGIAGIDQESAADIAQLGAMVQHSAPTVGGGAKHNDVTVEQGCDAAVGGSRTAAYIQNIPIGIYLNGGAFHRGDVIGIAVAVLVVRVLYLPPGAGFLDQGHIAAFFQSSQDRSACRFAHI